jgi:hypothetical protein
MNPNSGVMARTPVRAKRGRSVNSVRATQLMTNAVRKTWSDAVLKDQQNVTWVARSRGP